MSTYKAMLPEAYKPRIIDEQIERALRLFGAVEVSGTKWCGKTWASLAHAQSVTYVDRGGNLQLVTADPAYALVGDRPHAIDEWQRVPQIWDTVRHAVDDLGGERGAWILTGSSTPRKDEVAHSGAGRIGRVRMRTMTLQETGESSAAVSLAGLFEGKFAPAQCENGIMPLAELCCRGGWPELVGFASEDALVVTQSYWDALFEQSVPAQGGSAVVAQRLARSLARSLGQSVTNNVLGCDVFAHEKKDEVTDAESAEVSRHLELLSSLFVVDEVPGWVPPSRSPKRMRTKPKRYFADPSMAPALLGLDRDSLMGDWQTFGLVFENLCMRELDVYARAQKGAGSRPLHYYRDDSGLEADAIIELADGRWGAVEIKLASTPEKVEEGATSLLRLRAKLLKDPKARTREPSFLMVLTGMGEVAYQRADGVYVVPVRSLGA